eukprot:4530994-Amphidinium_carterae.1
MHALIQVRPGECLHTINLYGWVDDDFATRQIILEVAGRAAELPGSLVLVGGDWNLEPNEFKDRDDWIGFWPPQPCSRVRAPQYQGLTKNPEANVDEAHSRFWIDPAAWQAAFELQDVEALWELWNTAATTALE